LQRWTAPLSPAPEAEIHLLLLKQIAAGGLRLHRLENEDLPCPEEGTARVGLTAHVSVTGEAEEGPEMIFGRFSTRAGWAEEPEA